MLKLFLSRLQPLKLKESCTGSKTGAVAVHQTATAAKVSAQHINAKSLPLLVTMLISCTAVVVCRLPTVWPSIVRTCTLQDALYIGVSHLQSLHELSKRQWSGSR